MSKQQEAMNNSKAKFIQALAEATVTLSVDQEAAGEQEEQCVWLQGECRVFMAECRTEFEWLMFQGICSSLTVHAAGALACATLSTNRLLA